jgi:Ca2+/H+ antiporter, TMEM165/GDT1 family
MKRYWLPKFIGIVALATVAIFVFSFFVMYLWNETLPVLFHFPVINLWQSLDLLILSRLLFGGLRGPWGGRQPWKNRMQKKWMSMTSEEKQKFQEDWGNRCGPQFKEGKPQQ